MFDFALTDWVLIGVRTLIVLVFVALGWRDIRMLFRHPAPNMGTGLNRIWSVGRTTLLEAWAGRVWLLPILWLFAAFIMIGVIRVLDPTERMPLVIRTLLDTQTYLILVMMWVMACISLPRDRERKIILTNASKPLSRLEIVLGKMFGFTLAAAALLMVMGLLSWGILEYENGRVMGDAANQFELQKADYSRRAAPGTSDDQGKEAPLPPSQALNSLAHDGALFANNFVMCKPNGMSIMGDVDLGTSPPTRFLKGSSSEKAIYHFSELPVTKDLRGKGTGERPYFVFIFDMDVRTALPPSKIQIRVTAVRSDPHAKPLPRPQEKILTLGRMGVRMGNDSAIKDAAVWEPDDPDEIFTWFGPTGEVDPEDYRGAVNVEVTCLTPGVYLPVWNGADADPKTGEPPSGTLFNMQFVPSRDGRFPPIWPDANPVMRGFERRDRQEISGHKDTDVELVPYQGTIYRNTFPEEGALFQFSGKDIGHIPLDAGGNFRLALLLEEYRSDQADLPTDVRVQILNSDDLTDLFDTTVKEITEKRLMGLSVPGKYLGKKGGDMFVWLTCITPNHSVSVLEDAVRIQLPETPFAVNLFKSEVVIFLEAMLLIVICVTCSVRVNWPVAMFCAAVCVIFGWFVDLIASLQEYGGLGSLNYHAYNGKPSAAYKFFDTLAMGTWNILGVISSFVPNFTIYKPTDFISNLENTPWSVLGWNCVWTFIFILPFIAIAYLLFRKQEVG